MPDAVHADSTGTLLAIEVAGRGLAGKRIESKRAFARDHLNAHLLLIRRVPMSGDVDRSALSLAD
jgi:hypothetical protein